MRPLELLTLVLVAAVYGAPAGAAEPAKDYPGRPIRMIVTNAPGSAVDILSRIVAVRMGSLLGQQVVVDNRPGACGLVAGQSRVAAVRDWSQPAQAHAVAL